ncbi:MAG: hypothetical protein NTY35_04050 [Planctomycetota bacterium]|nr:hypothetical protein [Planctomycetota bacterium]
MTRVAEERRPRPLLRVFLGLALLLSPARAQEDSKPEKVETIDPYTRGERKGLDAAGYVSLGPFPWCEGITTDAITRELGGLPILWVETEHFRIGSTLQSYKLSGDRIERKRVDEELARIRDIFPDAKVPTAKLDPWLRLHMYARRIEAVHAEFLRGFGVQDQDFGEVKPGSPPTIAAGPHLGMQMKFTVLLAERRSTVARFVRYALKRDASDPIRERLPGGSLFFGISAETVRSWSQESESAFHSQVAANVALNLLSGFRGMSSTLPVWFEYGYSHVISRRVDERYTLYAKGTLREDGDSWKWEPRVAGLIANDFAPSWKDLANEKRFEDLSGPDHLVAWSKVTWMLQTFGPERMRQYLMAVTDPLPRQDELDRAAFLRDRQLRALEEVAGVPTTELEDVWRRWAAKATSKR